VENPRDLLLWGLTDQLGNPSIILESLLYTLDPDDYYPHDQLDPVTKPAWGNLSTFQILLKNHSQSFVCSRIFVSF